MLAAQQAPIGAKICTTSANRTIGRKFLSRLRIANPSGRDLITLGVRSRDQVPGFSFPSARIGPARVLAATARDGLLRYHLFRSADAVLQPIVVSFQSFRRL